MDAYWHEGDQAAIDGPGAESFIELSKRAKVMLNRLATSTADSILVFSHGEDAGTPEKMRLFRELDTKDPLPNCAGYDLELRDGRWKVLHLVGQDSEVKFIDEFCTDQRMAPIPPGGDEQGAVRDTEWYTERQGRFHRLIFSGGWETSPPMRAGSRRNLSNW